MRDDRIFLVFETNTERKERLSLAQFIQDSTCSELFHCFSFAEQARIMI